MSERLLEFHCRADLLKVLPPPVPATRCMPQWLHTMPAFAPTDPVHSRGGTGVPNGDRIETVKNCLPFIEAMGFGYIIPLPADMTFTMENGNIRAEVVGFDLPLIDFHNGDQVPGAPFGKLPIVKFHTPWLIKTPPGYSTLVLPPLNRFDMPFIPFAGVVETDTYYRQVAYPTMCTMSVGDRVVLQKGMPLVQVVPVLRESWACAACPSESTDNSAQHQRWEQNPHMYRDEHWKKKSFH